MMTLKEAQDLLAEQELKTKLAKEIVCSHATLLRLRSVVDLALRMVEDGSLVTSPGLPVELPGKEGKRLFAIGEFLICQRNQ